MPRKFVISYKQEPGRPQYVALYDQWDLDPQLDPAIFVFKPPADGRKLAFEQFLSEDEEEEVTNEK